MKAEKLSANSYLMDVQAPRVAKHCLPGQFVIVKMDEKGERIPLTICDYDREAGTVTIVFQPVGASTSKFVHLSEGDAFRDFTGPLGCPSELLEENIEDLKTKKILFPIIVTVIVVLIVPSCAPLIGCLMFGNLIKESGVVPKLVENASNSLLYIVTILLGLTVGATATASNFLSAQTLLIFTLGIIAFIMATAGGVLIGKLMCVITKGKINPMIGAAGVSAVPMAARVVQKEATREDPSNFLLMHAMGPNVAGVIGSAVAAGLLIMLFSA
jgi:hypothetical protein